MKKQSLPLAKELVVEEHADVGPAVGHGVQQGLDEIHGFGVDGLWEVDHAPEDVAEDGVLAVPCEGGEPVEQLVGHDPQTPQVHLFILLVTPDDFGGDVVQSATKAPESAGSPGTPTEVSNLGHPEAHRHIFRLDVTVNDARRMNRLDPLCDHPHHGSNPVLLQSFGRRCLELEVEVGVDCQLLDQVEIVLI
jgi:hypothetical protein